MRTCVQLLTTDSVIAPKGLVAALGPGTARAAFRGWVRALTVHRLGAQVDTPWRKAQTKVEGEDEYEQLDKVDRLDVFQEYIKCAAPFDNF